jgi:hypothetical protein
MMAFYTPRYRSMVLMIRQSYTCRRAAGFAGTHLLLLPYIMLTEMAHLEQYEA